MKNGSICSRKTRRLPSKVAILLPVGGRGHGAAAIIIDAAVDNNGTAKFRIFHARSARKNPNRPCFSVYNRCLSGFGGGFGSGFAASDLVQSFERVNIFAVHQNFKVKMILVAYFNSGSEVV